MREHDMPEHDSAEHDRRSAAVIIETIDATDPAAFASWFAVAHAAEQFDWPEDPGWSTEELLALVSDVSHSDHLLAVAHAPGLEDEPAGALWMSFPKLENLSVANANALCVAPDHRRRGTGRALLEHAEEAASSRQRTRVVVTSTHRLSGPSSDPGSDLNQDPYEGFARGNGYERAIVEARRQLRLPPDWERLNGLERDASRHAAGYELVAWRGHCPGELVGGRAQLMARMSTDTPQGDLDLDREEWDADRLRTFEAVQAAMGRLLLGKGALTRTGELVAVTELSLPTGIPEVAYQLDTIVAPDHRGRRLGTLLKVANLRELATCSPETARVLTWNATENEHMVRVNETLGFELVGLETAWQRSLPEAAGGA